MIITKALEFFKKFQEEQTNSQVKEVTWVYATS